LTTKATVPYIGSMFARDDSPILGRDIRRAPSDVAVAGAARLRISMRPDVRSLGGARAGAIVLREALRRTSGFSS